MCSTPTYKVVSSRIVFSMIPPGHTSIAYNHRPEYFEIKSTSSFHQALQTVVNGTNPLSCCTSRESKLRTRTPLPIVTTLKAAMVGPPVSSGHVSVLQGHTEHAKVATLHSLDYRVAYACGVRACMIEQCTMRVWVGRRKVGKVGHLVAWSCLISSWVIHRMH